MRLTEARVPGGEKPTFDDCVMLDNGVGIVPELDVVISDVTGNIHLRLTFSADERRYQASFVGLATEDITSTKLREVKVAESIRIGASFGIFFPLVKGLPANSLAYWVGPGGSFDLNLEDQSDGLDADETLELVALCYEIAELSSQHPAKAVQQQFGLSQRTAARWISRAKARGYVGRPLLSTSEETLERLQFELEHEQRVNDDGEHQAET